MYRPSAVTHRVAADRHVLAGHRPWDARFTFSLTVVPLPSCRVAIARNDLMSRNILFYFIGDERNMFRKVALLQ